MVTGVAANTAAFVVAVGGAAVAIDLSVLLPVRYLRVLPKAVLDCVKATRRRPLTGTPIDITAAAMPLADFQQAIQDGRIGREAAVTELMSRGVVATTQIEITRLRYILDCVQEVTAKTVASTATVSLGAFTLALALASKVVANSIGSAVGGVVAAPDSESTSSTTAAVQRATVKWPKSMEEFASVLNAWQVILHSTGLCDFLVSSEFLRQVVFDTMECHGHGFSVAHALLLIYLERVETTNGDDINIANVFSLGSMDTFMSRAVLLAAERGIKAPDRPSPSHMPTPLASLPVFNGQSTPAAARSCHTFNIGTGAAHPANSLMPSGTCKYKHVCDGWVSDKGPKGVCGSAAHCRKDCDNPAKCAQPQK